MLQQHTPGSGHARKDGNTAGFVFLETAQKIPGGVWLRLPLLEVFGLFFVCFETEGTLCWHGSARAALFFLLFFPFKKHWRVFHSSAPTPLCWRGVALASCSPCTCGLASSQSLGRESLPFWEGTGTVLPETPQGHRETRAHTDRGGSAVTLLLFLEGSKNPF